MDPKIPQGSTPLAKEGFQFHCHSGVSCYLSCCHSVDMFLYPYDVLVLKNHLGISSSDFLRSHSRLVEGSHPYFPGVMLRLAETKKQPCPFLVKEGCSVYPARPSACRTYPLERGVERKEGRGGGLIPHYYLTHHPYCKGHQEARTYTLRQWERDQALHEHNLYNDLWAEMDAFFATNPWQGEGHAGPRQQLAFMVCYNIDDFRTYLQEHQLLKGFKISKNIRRSIEANDGELLKFGFNWLRFILGGRHNLIPK